jgi:hypothetical protein
VSRARQAPEVSLGEVVRRASGESPLGIFRELWCTATATGVLSADGVASCERDVGGRHPNQFSARSWTRSGSRAG